eukprot:8937676-Alexandrium_andersonii.AAC.1
MRNYRRRSQLQPRGPRNGLIMAPRRSGGVRSAPLFALMQIPPTTRAVGRVGDVSQEGPGGQSPAPRGLMITSIIVMMPS